MSNFLLSFELLYLMEWLLKHDKKRLEVLIKHALDNGLAEELETIEISNKDKINELFQKTFLGFISFLENALHECIEKTESRQQIRNTVMSSLAKLNLSSVDSSTLLASLKQAELELKSDTSHSRSKEILLQKILKNWNPENKEVN